MDTNYTNENHSRSAFVFIGVHSRPFVVQFLPC